MEIPVGKLGPRLGLTQGGVVTAAAGGACVRVGASDARAGAGVTEYAANVGVE